LLSRGQIRLRLLDGLRTRSILNGGELGLGDLGVGVRGLNRLWASAGLNLFEFHLRGVDTGLGLGYLSLQRGLIQLGDDVAGFDLVADVYVELRDPSADLRAETHAVRRLDRTGVGNRLADRSGRDLRDAHDGRRTLSTALSRPRRRAPDARRATADDK